MNPIYPYLKIFSIIHRFSFLHLHQAAILKKARISGHQMGYIICICMNPGISQEGVSSFLHLDKGAVAKGIRPLVEDGYIRRAQSETDRRAYELYPTEKAEALQEAAEKVNTSLEKLLTNGMSEDEQKTFKRLLLRACDNVMAAVEKEGCKK